MHGERWNERFVFVFANPERIGTQAALVPDDLCCGGEVKCTKSVIELYRFSQREVWFSTDLMIVWKPFSVSLWILGETLVSGCVASFSCSNIWVSPVSSSYRCSEIGNFLRGGVDNNKILSNLISDIKTQNYTYRWRCYKSGIYVKNVWTIITFT